MDNDQDLAVNGAAAEDAARLRQTTISELEALGFTHATWKCAKCGNLNSRGFALMRIRAQIGWTATILDIARRLHCPRCRQRPDAELVNPSKKRMG